MSGSTFDYKGLNVKQHTAWSFLVGNISARTFFLEIFGIESFVLVFTFSLTREVSQTYFHKTFISYQDPSRMQRKFRP